MSTLIRRGFLLALAFALLAGGTPPDDDLFRSERQLVRHLTVKLARLRSARREPDLTSLSSSLARLKLLLEQMTALAADLSYQEGRVQRFRALDLEPKSEVQASLARAYDGQIETLKANLRAFVAANHMRYEEGSPAHRAAQVQADAMVREINRLVAERDQKLLLALQAYAAAQKEYARLLARQDQLQADLDRLSAEFQAARGPAVTELHSLEGALHELRRAAGSALALEEVNNPTANRLIGGMVFDRGSMPPVDLPDVSTPDGSPAPLTLPVAASRGAKLPPALVNNALVRDLQAEAEALRLRGRELETEKGRLYLDKGATSEAWTRYGRSVQKHGVELARHAMITLPIYGSKATDVEAKLVDLDAMDAVAPAEPPPPGQEPK